MNQRLKWRFPYKSPYKHSYKVPYKVCPLGVTWGLSTLRSISNVRCLSLY